MPLERGKPNELAPRTLKLASLAWRRLVAFIDHVERQLAPNRPLAAIRPFAHKVPADTARLGGVLALIDRLDVEEILGYSVATSLLTKWLKGLVDRRQTPSLQFLLSGRDRSSKP